MTAAVPNNDPAASAGSSLFEPRWRTLLIAALVGFLLGSIWWFAQPNEYRATATVLVNPLAAKQLGSGSEVIPVRTIENEKLFAGSSAVRAPIQVQMPEAVEAMTITIDDDADALRFTATSDDPQLAEQIATLWSTTFVTERRKALITNWSLSAEAIQRELDSLNDGIVARSDQGDQAGAGDLSVRRDAVMSAVPEINQQLSLLRGSTAAEFLGPVAPAARSREVGFGGRAFRGTLLGLLVGAVLAAVLGGPILPPKKPVKKPPVRPSESPPSPNRQPVAVAGPASDLLVPDSPVIATTPTAAPAPSTSGAGLELPSYLRDALAPQAPPTPQPEAAPPEQPLAPSAPAPATQVAEPAPAPSSPAPASPTPASPAPASPTPEPAPNTAPAQAEPPAPAASPTPRIAPVPDVAPRPARPRLRRVELDPPSTID